MKMSAIILPILLVLAAMLVQLLLGGVAGAAVIMKLGWQRFKDMFRSSDAKERETKSDE